MERIVVVQLFSCQTARSFVSSTYFRFPVYIHARSMSGSTSPRMLIEGISPTVSSVQLYFRKPGTMQLITLSWKAFLHQSEVASTLLQGISLSGILLMNKREKPFRQCANQNVDNGNNNKKTARRINQITIFVAKSLRHSIANWLKFSREIQLLNQTSKEPGRQKAFLSSEVRKSSSA